MRVIEESEGGGKGARHMAAGVSRIPRPRKLAPSFRW